jgi:hypothetical protein
MEEVSDFIKERNEVFASMDKEKILEYSRKYNTGLANEESWADIPEDKREEIFWASVHKVICNIFLSNFSDPVTLEQYTKSADWLIEHGYTLKIN